MTTDGATPLYMASQLGHVEVVKALLDHPHTNVNQARTDAGITPLLMASQKGHVGVVKALLAHQQIKVNKAGTGESKATPLFVAHQNGHVDVVKVLLADGRVDPNIRRTYYHKGRVPAERVYLPSTNRRII